MYEFNTARHFCLYLQEEASHHESSIPEEYHKYVDSLHLGEYELTNKPSGFTRATSHCIGYLEENGESYMLFVLEDGTVMGLRYDRICSYHRIYHTKIDDSFEMWIPEIPSMDSNTVGLLRRLMGPRGDAIDQLFAPKGANV